MAKITPGRGTSSVARVVPQIVTARFKERVMPTDIEILDQAIANSEGVHRNLYTFRSMVKQLGEIKTQYQQTKDGLQSTEKYRDELHVQVEAARAEVAKAPQQRQQIVNEIAALNREIETKRTELQGLSNAIEQLKAMLRAA
jgi:predicted nuclease with TOPRIM domain